jgi:hypothetical protein
MLIAEEGRLAFANPRAAGRPAAEGATFELQRKPRF